MNNNGLESCPFCGNDEVELKQSDLPADVGVSGWSVECPCCQASGPHGDQSIAKSQWNCWMRETFLEWSHQFEDKNRRCQWPGHKHIGHGFGSPQCLHLFRAAQHDEATQVRDESTAELRAEVERMRELLDYAMKYTPPTPPNRRRRMDKYDEKVRATKRLAESGCSLDIAAFGRECAAGAFEEAAKYHQDFAASKFCGALFKTIHERDRDHFRAEAAEAELRKHLLGTPCFVDQKERLSAAEAKLDDIVRGKCAIKDCTNTPDQGVFIGTLCAPCANTNYKAMEARLSALTKPCDGDAEVDASSPVNRLSGQD